MSEEQDANKSGPIAKRMKLNDEENNPAERAVVAVNDEQQLADIFKLNVDCFEEVFDYLSLADLASMAQTCTRIQQIAGHFFQLNYRAEKVWFDKDGFELKDVKIDCFNNILENVYVNSRLLSSNEDESFLIPLKHSTSIKEIEFDFYDCEDFSIDIYRIKDIISKAEKVSFRYGKEMFDDLLDLCTNVKHLSFKIGNHDKVQSMRHIHPKLEHIQFLPFTTINIPAQKTFIELNTTIKQISIHSDLLWMNRTLFKNLSHKIDTLAIDYFEHEKIEFDLFCRFLNELYESGFYKKLHFIKSIRIQEDIDQLASVKGLVKLYVRNYAHVGALKNLEELCSIYSDYIGDLKTLPHMLSKLKRIHFEYSSYDDILPFIRHAEKVNKIKVESFRHGSHFDENYKILDLIALNKEREKLVGAHKITIYVDEDVYLATKWAMKQTDFSLIRMKRETSYDWKHWLLY
ncbi:uncharacterized protein LOC116347800 [Contarinia nasturtii]|uniref:uncharacterized protein LOC116347800 n=1 Tax=Contarinia nasturtii TaxID=265458 RepID=UPI0012D434A0|nr:uncharacterized protein LOC116347800 [Contarinia nasturtii]XP_031634391.1 uncharacterized protein LOC116347800 [Contarinia nasturtii]